MESEEGEKVMDLLKKHIDTTVILGAFAAAILWMNGRFNEIEREIYMLKTELAIVKTVMVMKNIMPGELAQSGKDE